MPTIYLDNCCYNRPFDDQSQLKIYLEAQAKIDIQAKVKDGIYTLAWSYILDYENSKNPYEEKSRAIAPWKELAGIVVAEESEEILTTAESLLEKGIKQFDALHVACAIAAGCDYFISTDIKLLKKSIPGIKLVNPIEFIMEMGE